MKTGIPKFGYSCMKGREKFSPYPCSRKRLRSSYVILKSRSGNVFSSETLPNWHLYSFFVLIKWINNKCIKKEKWSETAEKTNRNGKKQTKEEKRTTIVERNNKDDNNHETWYKNKKSNSKTKHNHKKLKRWAGKNTVNPQVA